MKKYVIEIRSSFPYAIAIVDFSFKKNSKMGDTDIAIVVPRIGMSDVSISKNKLKALVKKHNNLDPIVITKQGLRGKEEGVTKDGRREFHGMDRYRMKHQGIVIYGPANFVESLPSLTIKQALDDVLPYLRKTMIPRLRKSLRHAKNTKEFIRINSDKLLVLVRTMFSLERSSVASKIVALAWAKKQFKVHGALFDAILSSYLQLPQKNRITKLDINRFLGLVEKI